MPWLCADIWWKYHRLHCLKARQDLPPSSRHIIHILRFYTSNPVPDRFLYHKYRISCNIQDQKHFLTEEWKCNTFNINLTQILNKTYIIHANIQWVNTLLSNVHRYYVSICPTLSYCQLSIYIVLVCSVVPYCHILSNRVISVNQRAALLCPIFSYIEQLRPILDGWGLYWNGNRPI